MKNICLFGDSISKGVIIDQAKNRYAMTKQSFANLVSAYASWMRLANYSMLGCTISKGRSLIARHIKDVENCDITVLEYGGNDSDHNWAEIAADPDGVHLPKTPLEDFEKNYREIISDLKTMGKKIVMLDLPPIDEHKYFSWFSSGLNSANILKWLGGSERYIYDFHSGYNNIVCQIARDNDIPLVSIRRAFLDSEDFSSLLCDDGIHPNEAGHRLIASTIEKELPELALAITGAPLPATI